LSEKKVNGLKEKAINRSLVEKDDDELFNALGGKIPTSGGIKGEIIPAKKSSRREKTKDPMKGEKAKYLHKIRKKKRIGPPEAKEAKRETDQVAEEKVG